MLGKFKEKLTNFVDSRINNYFSNNKVEKKEDKTEEDKYIIQTFLGADNAKKEAAVPLVEYCRREENS